jgi:hypothetical protein
VEDWGFIYQDMNVFPFLPPLPHLAD